MIHTIRSTKNTCFSCNTYPEHFVQSGLSVTPARMLDDANHGIPIKSQLLETSFYDGDNSSDMSVPMQYRRGLDVNDAWLAQVTSREKLSKSNIVGSK